MVLLNGLRRTTPSSSFSWRMWPIWRPPRAGAGVPGSEPSWGSVRRHPRGKAGDPRGDHRPRDLEGEVRGEAPRVRPHRHRELRGRRRRSGAGTAGVREASAARIPRGSASPPRRRSCSSRAGRFSWPPIPRPPCPRPARSHPRGDVVCEDICAWAGRGEGIVIVGRSRDAGSAPAPAAARTTLCRRNAPVCEACPLAGGCHFAQRR